MPYITVTELKNRFPQFDRWNEGSETLINSVMIYYSEIELNSRLADMFTVPFAAAHPTVKDLTMQIARYRLYEDMDAKKAADYKKIIDGRIEAIRKGEEFIYTESSTILEPAGAANEIWSNTDEYHPVHSMLDAENPYTQISSDYLDELESERT